MRRRALQAWIATAVMAVWCVPHVYAQDERNVTSRAFRSLAPR